MSQLDVFGPFPATPREREAAIELAFGAQAPARIVKVRASRVPCLTTCGEPAGSSCSQPGPAGAHRRLVRRAPHPGRVALAVTCEKHRAAPGCPCPGESPVCDTRCEQVAEDVALLAAEAVARARRETVPGQSMDDWLAARFPEVAATVREKLSALTPSGD